jgi:predicted nucleic acid-binding protein
LSDLVLDASVTLAWCFDDEDAAYADSVLGFLKDHVIAVPALWFSEIANGIAVAERRGRVQRAEIARLGALLSSIAISVDHPLTLQPWLTNVTSLARRTNLSTYDATYLELAMRLGLPLATTDRTLRLAATNQDVPAFSPDRSI